MSDSTAQDASSGLTNDLQPPRHQNSSETTVSSVPSLTQSASTSSARSDKFHGDGVDGDAKDDRRRSADFTASPSPGIAPHVEIVGDDEDGSLARQLEHMGMGAGDGAGGDKDSDGTVADDKDPFDGLDPVVRYTADLYAWTVSAACVANRTTESCSLCQANCRRADSSVPCPIDLISRRHLAQKIRYDIALKDRERMDKQRQNGGKPGQSGSEFSLLMI